LGPLFPATGTSVCQNYRRLLASFVSKQMKRWHWQ